MEDTPDHNEQSTETHHDEPTSKHGDQGHAGPGGLSIAANGLLLAPAATRFELEVERSWTYQILDADREVVTNFEEAHGELSHLIVVRRDLTHFQHLHPEMNTEGRWSTQLTLPEPGVYRAFVDIVVDDQPVTLGVDLFAPGAVELTSRPQSTRQATAGEYEVILQSDEITANKDAPLEFEVQRDGASVSELAPYLGALGHLVALREGDLAYLHVHPLETDPTTGRVEFQARFPTRGRYRLFLQTRPEGDLITTGFDIHIE